MKTWQVVVLCIFAPAIIGLWLLLNSPVTKSVSLLDKATNTDKMLANYEWFYETSAAFDTRVSQIKSKQAFLLNGTEHEGAERQRLTMELSAVQQLCRELSARYKAKSGQLHVGYLKGKDLPESLPAEKCE